MHSTNVMELDNLLKYRQSVRRSEQALCGALEREWEAAKQDILKSFGCSSSSSQHDPTSSSLGLGLHGVANTQQHLLYELSFASRSHTQRQLDLTMAHPNARHDDGDVTMSLSEHNHNHSDDEAQQRLAPAVECEPEERLSKIVSDLSKFKNVAAPGGGGGAAGDSAARPVRGGARDPGAMAQIAVKTARSTSRTAVACRPRTARLLEYLCDMWQ